MSFLRIAVHLQFGRSGENRTHDPCLPKAGSVGSNSVGSANDIKYLNDAVKGFSKIIVKFVCQVF